MNSRLQQQSSVKDEDKKIQDEISLKEEETGKRSFFPKRTFQEKLKSWKKGEVIDEDYTIEYGETNINKHLNKKYGDNTITTTKYNLFTFFPKSIFFQFQRAANIYFLVISILTFMSFSPKEPSSMIGTFAFVLFVTMIKDAIEDYGRYKQDSCSNNRKVDKFKVNAWNKVRCHTLRPGDIIKITKEEEFSCDTLIIKSSNEGGYCYIDTKNLDGETNLKEKCALEEFKGLDNIESLRLISGTIQTEYPNGNLQEWNGVISNRGHEVFCSLKNLALKGCVLKRTEQAIGIVVYAGHYTKIMKNAKHPKPKVSKIMKTMNNLLYSLFAFDIIICIVFGCLCVVFVQNYGTVYTYIFPTYDESAISNMGGVRFGYTFLTFYVAYAQIIPISLYVAMGIIKLLQGVLIFYDPDIYDLDLKKPASCRATDLIEELGQVDLIFSDKTGTLTQNTMVFKKCFLNKKIYGVTQTKEEDAPFSINGDTIAYQKLKSLSYDDKKDKEYLEKFFLLLSLCHTVFPEKTDKGIIYQGNSPDDIALVKGAQQLGLEFDEKAYSNIHLTNHITQEELVYEHLLEIPFSSDRKRMSVVVDEKHTGRILLLSKGADGVMLSDANPYPQLINKFGYNDEINDVKSALDAFSREGLRILVMGQRYLDKTEWQKWKKKFDFTRTRSASKLPDLYAELEKDMQFIGCSAIEDKLQHGVPETIHTLLNCGIRVWVLTGDNQDTAEQIARQCKLIESDMTLINLSIPNPNETSVKQLLETLIFNYDLYRFQEDNVLDLEEINDAVQQGSEVASLSIIIDGFTLEIIISNVEIAKMFFLISVVAKSVVCCRVSPKQKCEVVKLAKKHGDWITLAIGDGANDVPMIMEASIGVGIQGKEGTHAVNAADYGIGQFRYLEKLILFYGRNGYIKVAKFICYYFYKNIVLVVTELVFAFYDGFSGQIYFAEYLGTMFNAFFTSWPCLFTFSLEKEHDAAICRSFPILYRAGPRNVYFNFKVFWTYILYAFFHSALAFFIPSRGMYGIVDSAGISYNHWRISTISFCMVIHIVTMKLMVISDFWNVLTLVGILASLAFYYLVLIFLSSETFGKMFQNELVGVAGDILTNIKSLLIIILGSCVIVLFDIIFKQIFYFVFPTPSQLIGRYKNTPEIKKIIGEGYKKTTSFKSDTFKSGNQLCPSGGLKKEEVIETSGFPLRGQDPQQIFYPNEISSAKSSQSRRNLAEIQIQENKVINDALKKANRIEYHRNSQVNVEWQSEKDTIDAEREGSSKMNKKKPEHKLTIKALSLDPELIEEKIPSEDEAGPNAIPDKEKIESKYINKLDMI